jgi:2-keto-4-pentenoate hydratase/2-oxohepta-3-ene-1,7-dioic acid hydratase in catechol pathway
MKIVGFEVNGDARLGLLEGDEVIDLTVAENGIGQTLTGVLAQSDGDLRFLDQVAKTSRVRYPREKIKFTLPVTNPGKIVCLGLNYLEHAKEGGHKMPDAPSIFMRCLTSLVPHKQPIVRPQNSTMLDYECELAVVIGKRGRHVSVYDAYSIVAGYSCFNDASLRDFQRRTSQWDMGKNFDATGGFGPWLVTVDELPPGGKGLRIETRLNGQIMQSDNTDNMMFPVAETIADVSSGMTLEPGDVLVMGTPSGVGARRNPQVWMKHGDVCEIEIEGIGILQNTIRDEISL